MINRGNAKQIWREFCLGLRNSEARRAYLIDFLTMADRHHLPEGLTEAKVFLQISMRKTFFSDNSSHCAVKDKGSALAKSMLASKNLPKPITKASEGKHWIRVLAAELALRLKDAREISPNLWPKTIVLHARKGKMAS